MPKGQKKGRRRGKTAGRFLGEGVRTEREGRRGGGKSIISCPP